MNTSVNHHTLRKQCYSRGVSMYDTQTLQPKTLQRILKDCYASGANANAVRNANTRDYGVPPKAERARAIRAENPGMTVKEALMLAEDPFFTFKNLRYYPELPVPGVPKTLKYTVGHDVWGILPEFFPGPDPNNKTNAPPPKRRVISKTHDSTKVKKRTNKRVIAVVTEPKKPVRTWRPVRK